jgi:hypothetical protein
MYTTALRNAFHTRRLTIRHQESGWEVLDERDANVKRTVYYDWHRVERALAMFRREAVVLESDGWVRAYD